MQMVDYERTLMVPVLTSTITQHMVKIDNGTNIILRTLNDCCMLHYYKLLP